MLELSVNNLPCVAITPELADKLRDLGEDPHEFNYFSYPAGASNYGEAVVLMHSDDAAVLAKNMIDNVTLKFVDDTQTPATNGVINNTTMCQIEQRPIHTLSVGQKSTSLVAVRIVDERYFWKGILIDPDYNMSVTADRSQTYTASENSGSPWTYPAMITAILTMLGIAARTTVTFAASGSAGTPNDIAIDGERAGQALDRLLASCGLIFVGTQSGYQINTPQAFNANMTSSVNDRYLPDRIAGDVVYSAGTTYGKNLLNAIMPYSVTVIFPRQIPSGSVDSAGATYPPVMNQFYKYTSIAGKPDGVQGRSQYAEIIHDPMWALGSIGSETNTAALSARGDFLASAYYSRFAVTHIRCRLKGWALILPVPGEIVWHLTPAGPFTEINTNGDWSIYGGNKDVVDGFLNKRVSGIGKIQTTKTFDGSLIISTNGIGESVAFLVTSNATAGATYNRYNAKSMDPGGNGSMSSTEDIIFDNGAEPTASFASNSLLAAANIFGVSGSGTVIGIDSGTGKRIVRGWMAWTACTAGDVSNPVDGGSP